MPLVFVPTPLGNLRDVTLRALEVLSEANLIAAEDTRVARKLMSALGISGKRFLSYHEHNAKRAQASILERANSELVAVLSDAGTPGICDPGSDLVRAAREAGISVQALPGPNAAVCAALLSGFAIDRFVFEGFPPRAAGARRAAFARSFSYGIPSIWYESPQRVRATLAEIAAIDPAAQIFLLREFTKLYEQQLLGSAGEVARDLPDPMRGEVTFVVSPTDRRAQAFGADEIDARIDAMLEAGNPVSTVAKTMAGEGYGERGQLYARAGSRKRARKGVG